MQSKTHFILIAEDQSEYESIHFISKVNNNWKKVTKYCRSIIISNNKTETLENF